MSPSRRLASSDSRTTAERRKGGADPGQSATMMRVYEPGTTVAGKYRLLELLGEGGMGTVWRAHNETLDVDVAVKLLRRDDPENVEGPLAGDRLLQEARAAARLGHPAI